MGSRSFFITRPNYMFPTTTTEITETNNNMFEFDESDDVWNSNESFDFSSRKPLPTPKKIPRKKMEIRSSSSSSLPLNIPDWSKILKQEYTGHVFTGEIDDTDIYEDDQNPSSTATAVGGGGGLKIPPHEYLARRRGESFSVHEGIGRTLKGRDLRRVRNAIWKTTGFLD